MSCTKILIYQRETKAIPSGPINNKISYWVSTQMIVVITMFRCACWQNVSPMRRLVLAERYPFTNYFWGNISSTIYFVHWFDLWTTGRLRVAQWTSKVQSILNTEFRYKLLFKMKTKSGIVFCSIESRCKF